MNNEQFKQIKQFMHSDQIKVISEQPVPDIVPTLRIVIQDGGEKGFIWHAFFHRRTEKLLNLLEARKPGEVGP